MDTQSPVFQPAYPLLVSMHPSPSRTLWAPAQPWLQQSTISFCKPNPELRCSGGDAGSVATARCCFSIKISVLFDGHILCHSSRYISIYIHTLMYICIFLFIILSSIYLSIYHISVCACVCTCLCMSVCVCVCISSNF